MGPWAWVSVCVWERVCDSVCVCVSTPKLSKNEELIHTNATLPNATPHDSGPAPPPSAPKNQSFPHPPHPPPRPSSISCPLSRNIDPPPILRVSTLLAETEAPTERGGGDVQVKHASNGYRCAKSECPVQHFHPKMTLQKYYVHTSAVCGQTTSATDLSCRIQEHITHTHKYT